MRLGGNEEDKMKRISPVLFLTLASATILNGQLSFAQSQSSNVAPGPIAELLPKAGTPAKDAFDLLGPAPGPNRLPAPNSKPQVDSNSFQVPESNALPPATSHESSVIEPPPGNALPLFDTPAQPRSTGTLINSPPPEMPSAAATLPRTPGSFFPGSTPVGTSQFGTGQEVVYSDIPVAAPTVGVSTLAGEPCGCQSAMVVSQGDHGCDTCGEGGIVSTGDCGCDTCGEGGIVSTGDCHSCNSGDDVFYANVDEVGSENYADCTAAECSQPQEGFYDTGADRIDSKPSGHSSRRGHKGIFARHRAKHLAKKEALAGRNQVGQGNFEQGQLASNVGQGLVAPAGAAVAAIGQSQANGSFVNTTIGANGLYFNRDYEDDRLFSASRFANERGLFSNDADHDDFGGYEVFLNRRNANGNGLEARFFDLEPSSATATLGGAPFTTLSGGGGSFGPGQFLTGVGVPDVNFGGGFVQDVTAADVFNFADVHQVTRETSIQNIEFNLLRLGRIGQRQRGVGRTVSHESLVGFRYFRFDESFNYSAQVFRPGTIASDLSRADYLNEVTNSLYGIQIGGRTEIGFLRRFSVIATTKAGFFNNNFTNNQNVNFSPRGAATETAQILDGQFAGQPFDTEGEDNDFAMIGEFDVGVTYQMFRNSRLRVGYRAIFVTDVALAVSQTETLFSDLNAVQSPTDNDDLFLQGGYFGAEFAF